MLTEEVDEELYQEAKALFYNSSEAEILQRCHDRAEHKFPFNTIRNNWHYECTKFLPFTAIFKFSTHWG